MQTAGIHADPSLAPFAANAQGFENIIDLLDDKALGRMFDFYGSTLDFGSFARAFDFLESDFGIKDGELGRREDREDGGGWVGGGARGGEVTPTVPTKDEFEHPPPFSTFF